MEAALFNSFEFISYADKRERQREEGRIPAEHSFPIPIHTFFFSKRLAF